MQTAVRLDDKTQKMAQLHPVRVYDRYRAAAPSQRYEILKNLVFTDSFKRKLRGKKIIR
jgi:hypothetical protein